MIIEPFYRNSSSTFVVLFVQPIFCTTYVFIGEKGKENSIGISSTTSRLSPWASIRFQYATRHLSVWFWQLDSLPIHGVLINVVFQSNSLHNNRSSLWEDQFGIEEREKKLNRMNERDLQLARAIVDLELDENVPKKTAVTKMHDKQQTFRYILVLIHCETNRLTRVVVHTDKSLIVYSNFLSEENLRTIHVSGSMGHFNYGILIWIS